MAKPKTIRCSNCSECAIDHGVGFVTAISYICTKFSGMEVSKNDGCTFGSKGEPMYICREHKVDNIDPTIYGYNDM